MPRGYTPSMRVLITNDEADICRTVAHPRLLAVAAETGEGFRGYVVAP